MSLNSQILAIGGRSVRHCCGAGSSVWMPPPLSLKGMLRNERRSLASVAAWSRAWSATRAVGGSASNIAVPSALASGAYQHRDVVSPQLTCCGGRFAVEAALLALLSSAAAAVAASGSSDSSDHILVLISPFCYLRSNRTLCEAEPTSKKKKSKKKKEEAAKRKTSLTPSRVASEDFAKVQESHDVDSMPTYTMEQVNVNNGDDGKPIWMTYGGYVYDVTDFIPNHPGGDEKIRLASGGAIEPFWYLYRQHYASDLPMRLMEHMVIGKLDEKDQEEIDDAMALMDSADPYAKEPIRHKSLIVHSDTPMNAEVPSHLLTKSYLTPTSLFYIRHHHPVPFLSEEEEKRFALEIDLSEFVLPPAVPEGSSTAGKAKNKAGIYKLSLDELKKLPKTTITATLQCSGNRRSGFNQVERTSGTPWGQGAISTSTFGGVKLVDLLKHLGVQDPTLLASQGANHVVFSSLDGMSASIGIEKAVNPFGDVLVCYEQNGELLTREHGYPLRIVVPGYAAVRNVKWVNKIQLSTEEAEGPWQRGLNYKTLPPGVTNASLVKLEEMPSMTEVSVFSGITRMETPSNPRTNPGDTVPVTVSGWAWAGGGRNIVRVDVTPDDGNTWYTADIIQGKKQPFGRAWAWVFWQVDIPEAKVRADGTIQVASKAVDLAHNVQPEHAKPMWNVRGLGNNSWYRAATKVVDDL